MQLVFARLKHVLARLQGKKYMDCNILSQIMRVEEAVDKCCLSIDKFAVWKLGMNDGAV